MIRTKFMNTSILLVFFINFMSIIRFNSCAPISFHPSQAYYWEELIGYGFCEFNVHTLDLGEDIGKIEEITCATTKMNCVQIHEDIGGYLINRGCIYLNRVPAYTLLTGSGPAMVF